MAEELGKTGGFPLAPFPLTGKGRRGHTLMKFFQKRAVAAVVLILAIVAGVVIGQAKKPDTGGQASTAIVGSYTYVYDYAGVLTDETMEHIDAMNASLFAQTGAQILVSVVNSTGGADIMDYASDLGKAPQSGTTAW